MCFFCDGFLCGNFCGSIPFFVSEKTCFRLDSWGFLYNLPSKLLLDIWISFLGVCGSHFIQSEIIDRLSGTMHMYMLCMCIISGWIIMLNSRNKATFGRIPSYIRPVWVRSHNDVMMKFCRWASLGPSCIRPWVFSQDTPNKTHGISQAGWATPMKFTKHPHFQHADTHSCMWKQTRGFWSSKPAGYHASQQLAAQVYEATGYRLATLPEEMGALKVFFKHPLESFQNTGCV